MLAFCAARCSVLHDALRPAICSATSGRRASTSGWPTSASLARRRRRASRPAELGIEPLPARRLDARGGGALLALVVVCDAATARSLTDGYPLADSLVSAAKFVEYGLLAARRAADRATRGPTRSRRRRVVADRRRRGGASAASLQIIGLVGNLDDVAGRHAGCRRSSATTTSRRSPARRSGSRSPRSRSGTGGRLRALVAAAAARRGRSAS